MFKEESLKKDMFSAEHRSFVGILFDDVTVKVKVLFGTCGGASANRRF